MKKIGLSLLTLLTLLLIVAKCDSAQNVKAEETVKATETCERPSPNYCGDNSLTNGLAINEATLFYMYSDEVGMYFLDPLADVENIIYVGHEDHKLLEGLKIDTDNLHHGQRFVGAFADEDLWELVALIEVDILGAEEKK